MSKRDYYEILGVDRGADDDTLKSAYRKLAMKYHPDRNPGDEEAEANFKEANEAYEILSDPEKRQRYDQFGHAGVDPNSAGGYGDFGGFGGFEDVSDIFSSFFGGGNFGGFGQASSPGPRRGSDVSADVHMSFAEAYSGASKEVSFYRLEDCPSCGGSGAAEGSSVSTCDNCGGSGQVREVEHSLFGQNIRVRTCPSCQGRGEKPDEPCSTCKGKGKVRKRRTIRVTIPAGVDNGHVMTLAGEGDIGELGGPKGDLLLRIFVASDPNFKRQGLDVFQEIDISFTQAALGDEIEIQGLDGKLKFKIAPGSQPGSVRRISGGGFPNVRGHGKGHHYITLNVEVPTKLNDQQKTALRAFADSMGEEVKEKENKGFFGKVKDAMK